MDQDDSAELPSRQPLGNRAHMAEQVLISSSLGLATLRGSLT
jgi:hypothetical protein